MSKKRVFIITTEDAQGEEIIDTIVHKDGDDYIKHNNKREKGEYKTPSDVGQKTWFLSNPQYWWKDSKGVWHCYCWGGSTC